MGLRRHHSRLCPASFAHHTVFQHKAQMENPLKNRFDTLIKIFVLCWNWLDRETFKKFPSALIFIRSQIPASASRDAPPVKCPQLLAQHPLPHPQTPPYRPHATFTTSLQAVPCPALLWLVPGAARGPRDTVSFCSILCNSLARKERGTFVKWVSSAEGETYRQAHFSLRGLGNFQELLRCWKKVQKKK